MDYVGACANIRVVADTSSTGKLSARSDVAERAYCSVVGYEGSCVDRDVPAELCSTAYDCVRTDDATFIDGGTRRDFR